MVARDENALICDFAETYHIYDYKSMPPKMAAILAVGLPNDARIKRSVAGQKQTTQTMLLAMIADALNLLVWFQTEDGRKNRNRPKSVLEVLTKEEETEEYEAFNSIEAYEAARRERMTNG